MTPNETRKPDSERHLCVVSWQLRLRSVPFPHHFEDPLHQPKHWVSLCLRLLEILPGGRCCECHQAADPHHAVQQALCGAPFMQHKKLLPRKARLWTGVWRLGHRKPKFMLLSGEPLQSRAWRSLAEARYSMFASTCLVMENNAFCLPVNRQCNIVALDQQWVSANTESTRTKSSFAF